ncbi:MAG TPA: hypothetical protein VGC14_25255 [Rhizobium sp.]
MVKLTNAEFAQQCAYIAKTAASWAGDLLILPETYQETPRHYSVERFVSDMRKHLDFLAERAALNEEARK